MYVYRLINYEMLRLAYKVVKYIQMYFYVLTKYINNIGSFWKY
jgi:hypothetical protein